MMDDPNLAAIRAARAAALSARRRMGVTLAITRDAVKPQRIAGNAWESVREMGGGIAGQVVEQVKSHPFTASGIGTAITIALARRPLRWLSDKLSGSGARDATEAEPATFNAADTTPEAEIAAAGKQHDEGVTA